MTFVPVGGQSVRHPRRLDGVGEGALPRPVTLHNEDEVARKDVREGDWVLIQRAGDVIPEVVKVITSRRTGEEKPFRMPSTCPVCDTPLVRLPGEAVTRCPNPDCSAQLKRSIRHFAGKGAMDIDGLGEKIVEQLVENLGLVQDVADLYRLQVDDLVPLERFAEKSAQNIVNAIQGSKTPSLGRFIYALLGSGSSGRPPPTCWPNIFRISRLCRRRPWGNCSRWRGSALR